jgi:hypothetical protein
MESFDIALLIGTRKGLFIAKSDASRSTWTMSEPMFLGHIAQHCVLDPRNNTRLVLACATGHLGPTVFFSDDFGANWKESSRPPAFRTGESLARSVKAVFWLTPGHASQPDVWFAGASPQGMFRSVDGGDTWDTFDGWNDHPMWPTWCEWPEQNTPDGSMLHSINIDPRDAAHMYLGLSSGGVFESTNSGAEWVPLNRGCEAVFLPSPDADYGHDPHCVRVHPTQPDRLYQQNHCGIYRMDRPDNVWKRIGNNMPTNIGDIGFPIELHPTNPDIAWVFPMDGTDVWPRTSPDGIPAVFRTNDGGERWQRFDAGLPKRGWFTVKRQAMTVDAQPEVGVYFGTTSGEMWASTNEGESWNCIASHLPEIYSVECATLR